MTEYLPVSARAEGQALVVPHAPAPALAPWVVSYFTLDVPQGGWARVRTLPEGCADVLVSLAPTRQAWLSGPRTTAEVFEHEGETCLIGARLQPGAARLLGPREARAWVDASEPLAQALGEDVAPWIDALAAAPRASERVALFDAFLAPRFREAIEPRVARAVGLLVESGGAREVASVAREVRVSPRTLTRLFESWIGLSPKHLARVVRFQRVLARLDDVGHAGWAALAAELGYADQSHLIRDFAKLSGKTPSALD